VDVDERGFRIAVVADDLVNPPDGGFDALDVLRREDWGAVQLPPAWYPPHVARPLLEQIAEQVEEFVRHGYQLVLVGDRPGLEEALHRSGVALPEVVQPDSADELLEFLQSRPPVDPALARGETA
jgi:hypothetical protein